MNFESDQPLLLRPDNFTPPSRTPWGGTRIVEVYKSGLDLGGVEKGATVGESWELSVEPDFPSRCEVSGTPLAEALEAAPERMLGDESRLGRRGTALLVKLLDAADHLSVQVHPDDRYPRLEPLESGKPESWYVLARKKGAGIYIGLRRGVTEAQVQDALQREGDVASLLYFVPVDPGDFFVIDAGTPHAIGRGVTVVEPQHVVPGRRGVTYRFWDWNRKYDAEGKPTTDGTPRPLHVNDALAVTNWRAPREHDLLDRIRTRAGPPALADAARADDLCGLAGARVRSDFLSVRRLSGTGDLALEPEPWLRGLTVVAGRARLTSADFGMEITCGRSVALPASLPRTTVHLDHAEAVLSHVLR